MYLGTVCTYQYNTTYKYVIPVMVRTGWVELLVRDTGNDDSILQVEFC